MSKKIKITTSLVAGSLLLVNGAPFAAPLQAKEAPKVSVEKQNNNITAQVVEQNGKNYLSVTAHKDVNNVDVKVKVSNGQVITFKQKALKVNETVMFELNIKDAATIKELKSGKKLLPKTEIVRESLVIQSIIKGYNLNATVSYDVEKNVSSEKSDVQKLESEVSETTNVVNKVDEDVKVELKEEKEKSSIEEIEKALAEKEETTKSESKAQNETKATEEASVAKAPKVEKDVKVELNSTPTEVEAELDKLISAKQPEVKKEEVNKATSAVAEVKAPEVVENVKVKAEPVQATPVPVEGTNFKSSPKNAPVAKAKSVELVGNFDEVIAQEVYAKLNAYRVANGLNPVNVAVELSSGAEVRAKEFAHKALSGVAGYSLHSRLDNSKWYTAFAGQGTVKAENLSFSVNGSEGLMNFWKNSKTHNAAMLNAKHTKVLVKVFKHGSTYYGVQIFS